MSVFGSIFAVLASLAFLVSAPFERVELDQSIFVIRGEPKALEAFEKEIGSSWEGGTLIFPDDDPSELVYWAYADRTALQARTFIFGAMSFGVEMEIFSYQQDVLFPTEREQLDKIALLCGAEKDPFFLTPLEKVRVLPSAFEVAGLQDCLSAQLLKADFPTESAGDSRNSSKVDVGNDEEILDEIN